ncbi:MAG: IgGFc-binding protein [Tahibacter sp.]
MSVAINIRRTTRFVRAIVVGACGLLHAHAACALADTEFWLAPPDVTNINSSPGGEPIYLILSGGSTTSTVTIDQPANGSFTPIVVTVPAFDAQRVNLTPFKATLETRPTNTIANTGLHVLATTPVSASYEVLNLNNAEKWTLHGRASPGLEFYIPLHKHAPFANEVSFAAPHQAFASFDVVATQNNTLVTVYSPVPLDGHAALAQFSVTLNRGQTYSGAYTGNNWQLPNLHPSGAVVIADKPIIVSIKDDSIHNPSGSCTDLTGDQIVPVAALGREYIAIKGSLNNTGDESLVVVATQNTTQIFLDGASTPTVTLFAGEYFRVDMDYLGTVPGKSVYLRASKPVYATHYSGFGCKMAMAQLPPIDRAGSRNVDLLRTDAQTFHLMVLAPSSAIGGFTVTGNMANATISASAFVDVPGTAGAWKAARISYNTSEIGTSFPVRISNSLDRFILGTLDGSGTTAAIYGYPSDYLGNAGLDLTLNAAPGTLPEPGGVVTYTLRASNVGIADLQLSSLSDSHTGDLNGQGCLLPQLIAPGAFYECSYNGSISGNAHDTVSTIVSANGTSLGTPLTNNANSAVLVTDVLPSIDVHNSASPQLLAPGGIAQFSVGVDNTGSVEAVQLTALIDDLHGNLAGQGNCSVPQLIAPGANYNCTYAASVTGPLGSTVTNTLTANASDDETNVASAQATATITLDERIFEDGFELP